MNRRTQRCRHWAGQGRAMLSCDLIVPVEKRDDHVDQLGHFQASPVGVLSAMTCMS